MTAETSPKKATIKDVQNALSIPGETLKSFADQWKSLSETDKEQIREGIGNGSMTY